MTDTNGVNPSSRSDDSGWYQNTEALIDTLRADRTDVESLGLTDYCDLVELRRGGQGVVYSAHRKDSGEHVAIKIGRDMESDHARMRFQREIELVQRLAHDRIVTIRQFGRTKDGRSFFEMPYITGEALSDTIRASQSKSSTQAQSRAAVERNLGLFLKICDAVSHAHQNGVIHRDLKPSNIRIDSHGEPHILDFGLGRLREAVEDDPTDLTVTEQFVGTLAYAAPEQTGGTKQRVDTRTDVYALGVVLYELLEGAMPYDTGGSFANALQAIEHSTPRRMTRARGIDRDLQAIVFKALQKNAADRYQSVDAFGTDTRRYLRGDPLEARPETAVSQLRKLIVRHKLAAMLCLTIFALAVGLAIVSTVALSISNARRLDAIEAQDREADLARQATAEAKKVGALATFYEDMFNSVRPDVEGKDVLVVDVLEDASRKVADQFGDVPEIAGLLHHTIGHSLFLLGRYDDALQQMQLGLAAKQQADTGIEDIVSIQIDIATVLSQMGQADESEAMMRSAHGRLVEQPEHSPLLKAQIVSALGHAAIARSDYVTAEPFLEDALHLKQQHTPEQWMEVAAALNNLGMVKEMLGKFEESAALYEAGLQDLKPDQRDHQFARAYFIHNLGNLNQKLGNLEEAEQYFRESLALSTELFGPEHVEIAMTMETLGSLLTRRGKFDEAERILNDSLRIRRANLPGDHMKIASTLATLAELRLEQQRFDESVTLNTEAREMRVGKLGASHWLVGKTDIWISRALCLQGNHDEAHRVGMRGYDTIVADRSPEVAWRLRATDFLCELYEQWPSPAADVPEVLVRLIEDVQGLEEADSDLVERLKTCLESVRSHLDSPPDG